MRRHAKAANAGSSKSKRAALPIGAFAAILAALALVAALASAAVPTGTTGSASNIQKTTATLNGTVNPQGALLEECKFEWGTTTSYGESMACNLTPAEIGEGTSNVAVETEITGLSLATTYHFRLVVNNSEGTANGNDQTFKTLSPPVIEQWAEGVGMSEAKLKAKINPEGFATTYKLEWGPTLSYGNSTVESSVGSDSTDHTVFKALTGLNPNATYHYRFIASSSIGTTTGPDRTLTTYGAPVLDIDCPNQVLRTGSAAQLSDCRAYEMVSPVDKNNGDITWLDETFTRPTLLNQASLSGEKIAYTAVKAFGDAVSAPVASQYIATRDPGSGWTTHSVNPPERGAMVLVPAAEDQEYKAFSPDLSIGWLAPESGMPLAPGAAEGYINLYKRDNATDSYQALTIGPRVVTTNPVLGLSVEYQGESQDGSRAIFRMNDALTPDSPTLATDATNLYEWVDGDLHLVNILPDGTPYEGDSSAGGSYTGQVNLRGRDNDLTHAISADGSRIFWEAWGNALYVRENPEQPQSALNGSGECTEPAKACTTPIAETGGGFTQPKFSSANPDGSKAIYTYRHEGSSDLYEYDTDAKTSTLIAENLRGVAGVSDDASTVYFVSEDNLAAGATAGKGNLYIYRDGVFDFIATLADLDHRSPSVIDRAPTERVSRVTPDGRHFAFMTAGSPTAYDNVDSANGQVVTEVYRYDADSGQLSCVSCNPTGARPSGSRELPRSPVNTYYEFYAAGWFAPWSNQLYAPRVLSDDGNRLFFNSFDSLVPQDSNGVQDVYQWEAPGTGSCIVNGAGFSEQNGGCVTLLSTGESADISEFVDASPSGADAFIRTKSSIAPQDPGLFDIYDVRVNGGFSQPLSPPPCVGDACQSPPEAPRDQTPASASFRGAGNPQLSVARNCGAARKRARRLSHRSKGLRRRAKRVDSRRQSTALRKRSQRFARKAKTVSAHAARCRRANRRSHR